MTVPANVGTGPGPITPDGCAVDFYATLAPAGEAEVVHAGIPHGSSVLELGCGTGRILRRLAALGHPVLGVDESPDMLAHAADLDSVCAPIEGLDLGRTFDVVLLASTLVNTPQPAVREAMLATARRHTAAGGTLVIQRHPPQWFDTVGPSATERDGVRYRVGEVYREGPLLTTTIAYEVGDRRWTHTFTARRLTDDELAQALHGNGFGDPRWLTDDRCWVSAPTV